MKGTEIEKANAGTNLKLLTPEQAKFLSDGADIGGAGKNIDGLRRNSASSSVSNRNSVTSLSLTGALTLMRIMSDTPSD